LVTQHQQQQGNSNAGSTTRVRQQQPGRRTHKIPPQLQLKATLRVQQQQQQYITTAAAAAVGHLCKLQLGVHTCC
jgi:hypothetical protein